MKFHFYKTGRQCDDPECAGQLQDTIIHFGENLPMGELTRGFQEGEVADLCLVMGSSITVTPAAEIPAVSRSVITDTPLLLRDCLL